MYVHNFPFLPETMAECCSVWHIKLSLNLILFFKDETDAANSVATQHYFFFLATLRSQSTIKKKIEKNYSLFLIKIQST